MDATRQENLEKLLERTIPDNTRELLDQGSPPPALAVVAKSSEGYWVSLHADEADALAYLRQDDSDYVPTLLVDLETGQAKTIEQDVSYRVSDEPSGISL